MLKLSLKWKALIIALILAFVPIVVISSHHIQLALMEHVSLKEFIVRMIVAKQNLNVSSSMYGSFYNSSWSTMYAIDVLNILNGLSLIDEDAVMQYLIGPNKTGPIDRPMKYAPKNCIPQAFPIVHTASALNKLDTLPKSLTDKIREMIRAHQNSTSKVSFWQADRTFLFEMARLMNETQYINFTLQKTDIIRDIDGHFWQSDRGIRDISMEATALEEIHLMETGWARTELPETTKNSVEFYILSLWDDTRYGFYESYRYYHPKYYEPTLEITSHATRAYAKVDYSFYWSPKTAETTAFMRKIGDDYGKLLAFVRKCQNRYGIFFDKPSDVDDKVTSLQIWPAYSAISLLKTIDSLSFLDQMFRWPAQPTFVESIGDRF